MPIKQAAELQSDLSVIDALNVCIREGINTKMKMVDAVSKRTAVSNRNVLKVLEKYAGTDAQKHRWTYAVGARGAQIFELLPQPAESPPGAPRAAADDAPPAAPPESAQDPF